MKRHVNYNYLFLPIAMVFFLSGISHAETSEQDAIELIRNNPCSKKFSSDTRLLRITRNEDAEDTLFSIQKKYETNNFKRAYVFKVSDTGYFVLSPSEFVYSTSTGNSYLVFAVTKEKGLVFPLYGCGTSENSFLALVKDIKLRINSTTDAESFMMLHYIFTKDFERNRLIVIPRDFKHIVEDRFSEWFSAADAERNFQKWSMSAKKLIELEEVGLKSKKTTSGYTTSVTYVSGMTNMFLNLEKVTVEFDPTGEIKGSGNEILVSIKKYHNKFRTYQ